MTLLARQPERWRQAVRVIYREETQLFGRVDRVSSEPVEIVPGADIIMLTIP